MVPGSRGTTSPVTVIDALGAQRVGRREGRAAGGEHALGQAVMVAQVDEQQPAMVALAVDPAGEPGGLPASEARSAPQVWVR